MPARRLAPLALLLAPLLVLALARAADKPAPPPPAAAANPAEPPAATDDDAHEKKLDPAHTRALADALHAKDGVDGVVRGKVYTLTLPRSDLDLHTLQFGDVPTEAGLASTLHVWRCNCGKYYLLGQLCLTDYESNDVLDSLVRGQFRVASVGPMLLEEKPRLVQIRFQAEGDMPSLIKTLTDAFRWVGDNRSKPNPIKLD